MCLPDTAEYWQDVKTHRPYTGKTFYHHPNYKCSHINAATGNTLTTPYIDDITCGECKKAIKAGNTKGLIEGSHPEIAKQKKREKTMVEFEPKNKEQAEAITKGHLFINKGSVDDFLVIGGKAGTGKTTIAAEIIRPYFLKRKILLCAISHQAKLVLLEKFIAAFGDHDNINAESVAGAVGMSMNLETGEFEIDNSYKGPPPIKFADIIVCDEGSMINELALELLTRRKKKKSKLIFLGDIRQLPPIRPANSEFKDKPSPIFQSKTFAILKERIRQGEESPILPFSDYFGDNTRLMFPVLSPAPQNMRNTNITDKGAIIFASDLEEIIEEVLPLYKYSIENKIKNIVRVVCYRNVPRQRANTTIRSLLFPEQHLTDQYMTGELICFTDNFKVEDVDEPISNSTEIQIISVEQTEEDGYKVWKLGFIYENNTAYMMALDKSEYNRHKAEVSEAFFAAKALPFGLPRTAALTAAWALKKKFAPIDYAYAITSHRAQGSTYNTVIVDENDIMSVGPISYREKSHSMYVAITRASTNCIIIDGQSCDPEALYLSIELSKSKL